MSDVEEIEMTIEQKHRKEKKDLQAKIQGLKKIAGKSDKKKKKEIQDDILKLETELERRHLEEFSIKNKNAPSQEDENNVTVQDEVDDAGPRISKAQKRRDKKAAEEKANKKMIMEQEVENINGPRNVETQIIKKTLSARGLTLHIIPSNGNCLYGAISHQLTVTGRQPVTVDSLRKWTADHIRENKENFIMFLSDPDTSDMLTDEQFEEYCNNVANTTTWGGQVELQALSNILKCGIHVIQSTLPSVITQGDEFKGTPLIITYHRHMYRLGEHYNSTKILVDNGVSEIGEVSDDLI